MLILFRPFKVGDVVTAGGVTGTVRVIDIFSTIIMTADNQKIIVPNGGITSSVITNINAEPTRRIDLTIGIGYEDDINKAKMILTERIQAEERILTNPAPQIAVAELAESSIQIVVRPWVQTSDYWNVRFNLTEKIKHSFDETGISFPYPQRDIHIHQISPLDSKTVKSAEGICSRTDALTTRATSDSLARLLSLTQIQRLQIFFPFQGKHVLFLVIADLAGRDQVIPGAASATGQWDQVIHGQFFERDDLLTIITPAGGSFLLPPAALAHLPGLGPLCTDLGLVHPVKTKGVDHLRHQLAKEHLSHRPDQI